MSMHNKYTVKQEDCWDGTWFAVYVNGQYVSAFRESGDAHFYGTWCANPNRTDKNERQESVHGSSNNPK